MLLRGPNPIYNYFWVAVLDDEKTVIPEFDLETGAENRWLDVKARKISRLMWYPFTEKLADRVSAETPRLCVEGVGPVLEMVIPEGFEPLLARPHAISQYFYYECIYCRTKIYWLPEGHEAPEGIPGMRVVPQSEPLHCPTCGVVNEWYCDRCKQVIDEPILTNDDPRLRFMFKSGEARCPDCEVENPQGLHRVQHLAYLTGQSHSMEYLLGYKKVEAKVLPMSYLRRPGNRFIKNVIEHKVVWNDLGEEVEYI